MLWQTSRNWDHLKVDEGRQQLEEMLWVFCELLKEMTESAFSNINTQMCFRNKI